MQYAQNWKYLFKIATQGNLDKPLTAKILSDPSHQIV